MSPSISIALAALLAAPGDSRAPVEALKARQAAEERAAKQLSEREGSILDALSDADQALARSEEESRRAEEARAASEKRLRAEEEEGAAAQRRLSSLRLELPPRLLAMARAGRAGGLGLLVSSRSLGELVKRRYLLERIEAHDAALLEEARRAVAVREQTRIASAAETRRLTALAQESQQRRAAAAALREERRTMLGAVQNARVLHERTAKELAGQGERLGQMIAAFAPRNPSVPGEFSRMRGKLPRPAEGPIEVGFGKVVNPRFNTVTVQKGVDIRAPLGAAVRAVAPGRVVHAGWFKGYGNLVIIDHGDGYHTLVAHLRSMNTAMGEEVKAGTQLGTVGDTASLKGPYLYFEIRERGRSIDPAQWLAP